MAKAKFDPGKDDPLAQAIGGWSGPWNPDALADEAQAARVWKFCRQWASLPENKRAKVRTLQVAMQQHVPGFNIGRDTFSGFLKRLLEGHYGEK